MLDDGTALYDSASSSSTSIRKPVSRLIPSRAESGSRSALEALADGILRCCGGDRAGNKSAGENNRMPSHSAPSGKSRRGLADICERARPTSSGAAATPIPWRTHRDGLRARLPRSAPPVDRLAWRVPVAVKLAESWRRSESRIMTRSSAACRRTYSACLSCSSNAGFSSVKYPG